MVFNKLYLKVVEFKGYNKANQQYIVNYGDRYRNDETISSSFVELTVNEVISKRFVKRQQMRWTKAVAHQLLQVRIQVLKEELKTTLGRWYPEMKLQEEAKNGQKRWLRSRSRLVLECYGITRPRIWLDLVKLVWLSVSIPPFAGLNQKH